MSQITIFYVAPLSLTLLLILSSATAATRLDEIVVTASRSEQTTFDAPAAIQSIDKMTIENAGLQVNLSEAMTRVPGVTILNRQNYAQDLQLSIRGFGARTAFGIRGLRLIVDGIPASMPDGQGQASTISLSSTQRIEVLKGPLAQLYGNASGGVVQAFSRAASNTPELTIQGYTGSFDTHREILQIAGYVGGYGLVADYGEFQSAGFRQNSKTKRRHFNGIVSAEKGRTKIKIVANVFEMPLALDPGGLGSSAPTDPTAAAAGFDLNRVRKTVDQEQLGLSVEHLTASGARITARTYAGHRDVFQAQFIQGFSRWIGLDRDFFGAGILISENLSRGLIPIRLSYGVDYDLADEYRFGGNAILGEISDTSRRQQQYRSYSRDAFFQSELFLSETTTITAGARASHVTLDVDDRLIPTSSGKIRYQATNPVLGISHHASQRLNIYANTGRGFESPSIAETSYTGPDADPLFNSSLKAAKSRHYELGTKYRLTDSGMLDFAAYRIETRDEITALRNNGGNVSYANAGKTQREGFELSYLDRLGKYFQIFAALNRINAIYSESFQSGAQTIEQGRKIPGIPQHFAFLEIAWSPEGFRQNPALRKPDSRPILAAEIISSGRLYADDRNTRSANGYTIANVRLSYAKEISLGLLRADLRINNIFDKAHIGSVIVASATPYEPAPGRNWLAGLRISHQF